jgi:hypothetical protein
MTPADSTARDRGSAFTRCSKRTNRHGVSAPIRRLTIHCRLRRIRVAATADGRPRPRIMRRRQTASAGNAAGLPGLRHARACDTRRRCCRSCGRVPGASRGATAGIAPSNPTENVSDLMSGDEQVMVGVAGFEPATPTSRTWCATRLRYTPTEGRLYICRLPPPQAPER